MENYRRKFSICSFTRFNIFLVSLLFHFTAGCAAIHPMHEWMNGPREAFHSFIKFAARIRCCRWSFKALVCLHSCACNIVLLWRTTCISDPFPSPPVLSRGVDEENRFPWRCTHKQSLNGSVDDDDEGDLTDTCRKFPRWSSVRSNVQLKQQQEEIHDTLRTAEWFNIAHNMYICKWS